MTFDFRHGIIMILLNLTNIMCSIFLLATFPLWFFIKRINVAYWPLYWIADLDKWWEKKNEEKFDNNNNKCKK